MWRLRWQFTQFVDAPQTPQGAIAAEDHGDHAERCYAAKHH